MQELSLEQCCAGGGTVFQLAERWLRLCRFGETQIASLDDDPERMIAFAQARQEAEQLLGSLTAATVDRVLPLDAPTLTGGMRDAARRLDSPVLAARAFAEALQLQCGVHFLDAAVPEGSHKTLQAGMAIPLLSPPLRDALSGAKMTVQDKNRGPWTDRLANVALLPTDMHGFEILLRRLPRGSLDALDADICVAFGALHEDLIEECDWDTDADRFFWVRPKNGRRQRDALERLLNEATARGVHVLVLPELCHTSEPPSGDPSGINTWRWVTDWFANQGRTTLRVLVAGSRHAECLEGNTRQRRNELLVLVDGCEPTAHAKFNPLTFPAGKLGTDAAREDIRTDRRVITLYASNTWSFVPLVCKDFLLQHAGDLLRVLRPSLVLIASMSEKTQDFENDATGLTSACQAVVVYANTPLVLEDGAGNRPSSVCLGFVTRPLVEVADPAIGKTLEKHTVSVRGSAGTESAVETPCLGLTRGSSRLETQVFSLTKASNDS